MPDFDFITEIEGNSKRKINISIDDMDVNYSYTKEKRDLIANDYWIFKKFPGLTNYFGSSIRSYNGIITNKLSESTFMQNLLSPLKGIGSITTVAAAVGGCIGLMTSPISVIPIILTTMTCLKVQQDVRLTSKKVKLDTENILLSSFMYEKIFQASILNTFPELLIIKDHLYMSRCGQRVDISHKNPENLDFWNQVIDLIILGVQVPRMAINLYGGYESTLKKQFSSLKDIQIKDFVKEIGSMVSSTSPPSDVASSLGSTIKPFSGTSSFSLDGAQFATMRQNQGVAFYNLMVDGSKALKDYMNTGKDVKKVLDIFMAPKKAVNHGYNMRGMNSLSNSSYKERIFDLINEKRDAAQVNYDSLQDLLSEYKVLVTENSTIKTLIKNYYAKSYKNEKNVNLLPNLKQKLEYIEENYPLLYESKDEEIKKSLSDLESAINDTYYKTSIREYLNPWSTHNYNNR